MSVGRRRLAIVARYWHRTIRTRSEIELKRQMVEQGMSADEIERVLAAGGSDCGRRRANRSRGEETAGRI